MTLLFGVLIPSRVFRPQSSPKPHRSRTSFDRPKLVRTHIYSNDSARFPGTLAPATHVDNEAFTNRVHPSSCQAIHRQEAECRRTLRVLEKRR